MALHVVARDSDALAHLEALLGSWRPVVLALGLPTQHASGLRTALDSALVMCAGPGVRGAC
jgi:hypothetical protein